MKYNHIKTKQNIKVESNQFEEKAINQILKILKG